MRSTQTVMRGVMMLVWLTMVLLITECRAQGQTGSAQRSPQPKPIKGVVSGETITIFLSQDRSIVQGGNAERVKAIFYSKDSQAQTADARPSSKGGPVPCAN